MIKNNANRATIASRCLGEPPAPPVAEQVYEVLRDHGFSIDEAIELSAQASHRYRTTTQRLFQFAGVITIQVTAGTAKLISAPRNYETPRRTLERIQAQENIELNRRAREIRERREKDERRGNR